MIRHSQSGATLIELVIAIVIITMAASTIIGLLAFMSRNSAEAMVQAQSTSIANAYLKQILSNTFDAGTDEIDDFDGNVDDGVVDAAGIAIPSLGDYTVSVDVSSPGLGVFPNEIAANDTRLVTVTVTDPLGNEVRLSGFKIRHPR